MIEIETHQPEAKPKGEPDKKDGIPPDVFPVPCGEISFTESAETIFGNMAGARRLFCRGADVHEVSREPSGDFRLSPVCAERFCNLVETFGFRVMRRETRGKDMEARWRSVTMPQASAKVLLLSDAARERLPAVRQLVAAPVLAPDADGRPVILGKGWHDFGGGTFITGGRQPEGMPLAEAVAAIRGLLADFDFPSPGDLSRAVASIISPAMKTGGWIADDFPMDLAEADQSQSGKTFRQKLVATIYSERPSSITNAQGGVGSLDERIANALIGGRPFIMLDNVRGKVDSQTMEAAIRGHDRVTARALRQSVDVDCTPFLWQLSTNGAELTRDLANRSIVTRIRKRPAGYRFQTFPEGDIMYHLRANQPRFLGAVHSIVRAWADAGRPATDESRHDFRGWVRAMDWIVREIFELAPLLDGHRQEQMRTANPKLQLLREMILAAVHDGHTGQPMTARDLAEIAEDHDLELPGRPGSQESPEMQVGRMLGRLFREAEGDTLGVDGWRFVRRIETEYDQAQRREWQRKVYVIEEGSDE